MDPVSEIGAFDAKTHFSELLAHAEHGHVVTITRRGRPGARLVPVDSGDKARAAVAAVAQLRALRQGATLGGLDWRALRDEGRR